MEKPLFSIVVPCYNIEEYLIGSMESILSQPFKDWEVILVDDGSTDATGAMIKSFTEMDPRIHYYSQVNKGVSVARNIGIEHAIGEYIYFLDADDTISDRLLTQLSIEVAEEKPDLIVFGYDKIGPNLEILRRRIPKQNKLYQDKDAIGDLFIFLENNELFNPPWNKLYRLNLLVQNNIKFPPLAVGEDAVFNYIFFRFLESAYVIAEPLYNYLTLREGSATENENFPELSAFTFLDDQKKQTMNQLGLNTSGVYETDLIVAYYNLFKKSFLRKDISRVLDIKITLFKEQVTSHYQLHDLILRISKKNNIKLFLLYHTHLFRIILVLQSILIKVKK
ncbi:glycosyltransferase family 2 protein [Lapidilactobacillus mulanensis]|uniref:Glycosyltransferase family 2 protein n=1 Tax=Lapidilactobacillus mulanensis TaxID=2485999 RepID=A0ABW4DRG3_9LACO|nr:glycosyltransferase family 2 protein [Lapidilactobacillus mulanensis]